MGVELATGSSNVGEKGGSGDLYGVSYRYPNGPRCGCFNGHIARIQ